MRDHASIMIWALLNSNLEGRLPVHSVGITSGPLCALSECVIVCVCVCLCDGGSGGSRTTLMRRL